MCADFAGKMGEPAAPGQISRGQIYRLDGVAPRIDPEAWIAPSAVIIGDVEIGPHSSVWFHCVLRGDDNLIRIGARCNIQDGTIIHVNSGEANGTPFATLIGDDVSIGHAAIIHACTLEPRAFVGMGATVLDGAVIEAGGMLAAGGLLAPGKRIGRNELWAGAPARLKRVMDAEERALWDRTAVHYARLARRFRDGLSAA
jgi:carbonic anhydrase/acetyltransferase-like protein (isoleucine patch superfamily)